MKIKNEDFFYCYSPILFRFLKDEGLNYLCIGLAENPPHKKFWQFQRTNELYKALDEYRVNKPNN